MCVIMLATKVRPTEEMVNRAFDHNKDGVGIAWREDDTVVWKKGIMNLEEAREICKETPLPYVVHFRVASVGGVKESLTHPFVISKDANLALEGRTKGAVLFHNGHWSNWNEKALDAAIYSNSKIPTGQDWSDTRAMAWMVHIYGPGFMDLLTSQKGVLVTPRKFNVFTGNGWDKVNDVWCSNDYFWKGRGQHSSYNYSSKLCSRGKCTNRTAAGKEICDSCERSSTPAPTASDDDHAPVSGNNGGNKRPLVQILTLSEVQKLYSEKKVSKSTWKKFQKWNNVIGKGGNREARAKATLLKLSVRIADQLLHGSPA